MPTSQQTLEISPILGALPSVTMDNTIGFSLTEGTSVNGAPEVRRSVQWRSCIADVICSNAAGNHCATRVGDGKLCCPRVLVRTEACSVCDLRRCCLELFLSRAHIHEDTLQTTLMEMKISRSAKVKLILALAETVTETSTGRDWQHIYNALVCRDLIGFV